MEIKVRLSNLRTAPRKVRQVVDLVRGKNVQEAQSILLFTVNKSAKPVSKLLASAVASAKHDFNLDESNLFISEITANEGPKLKRWHPMSRGRAYPIIKRSSHIELTIKEIKPTKTENNKVKEAKLEKETKTLAVKTPSAKTKTTKTKTAAKSGTDSKKKTKSKAK